MSDQSPYTLTAEHRKELDPWAEKWIANALSTKPMTSDEKMDCVQHVKELYQMVGMNAPEHIIFVPSPYVGAICAGFAAVMEQTKSAGNPIKFTIPEMVKYVLESSHSSNYNSKKWFLNPYSVRKLAAYFGLGEDAIDAVKNANRMYNGGNQFSAWVSYVSFFRHIAKFDIDYTKWNPYERLAELSGPRFMYHSFCIISDRPRLLTVDRANSRPHNDTGPFCEWSDGFKLFTINGVRIPAWIVLSPDLLSVQAINDESNAEVRRIMIDKYGVEKYIQNSNATIVNADEFGTLYIKIVPGDIPIMMVKVKNSTKETDGTYKDYWLRVDPDAYGGLKTARAAVASTWRNRDGSLIFKSPDDYILVKET